MKNSVPVYVPDINIHSVDVEATTETFVVLSGDIQKCIVMECAGAKFLCVLHKKGTVEAI